MKRLIFLFALLPAAAFAQSPSGATRVQGVPAGYGDPVQVAGTIAHDAADSGSPVKVGGIASTTAPVAVTALDRVNAWFNLNGAQVVQLGDSNGVVQVTSLGDARAAVNSYPIASFGQVWNGATWDRIKGDLNGTVVQPALSATFWNYAAAASGIVNTTTAVTIKTAAGASVRNYVCSLQISHDTLGGATEVALRDGAGGTVMWRGRLQTTATDSSESSINFTPCLRGTANTLTEVVTLTAVTGGVYVNAQGHTGS